MHTMMDQSMMTGTYGELSISYYTRTMAHSAGRINTLNRAEATLSISKALLMASLGC